MYVYELPFERLSSIVRSNVNTDYDLVEEHVRFYIFDTNENLPFELRYKKLLSYYTDYVDSLSSDEIENNKIFLLETFWLYNYDELIEFHNKSVENGYEGTMIRRTYFSDMTEKGLKKTLYQNGKRSLGMI